MKRIYKDEKGQINFDRYFSYIKGLKGKLPEAAYEYAVAEEHYNLQSHTSLHDAWLEHCELKEVASGKRNEVREAVVDISFLGPFHDKRLKFRYNGVSQYRTEAKNCKTGMGDLNFHELSLNDDNYMTHEFFFVNGSVISVTFKVFEYNEENL